MSEVKKGTEVKKWDEVKGGACGEILEAFLSSESDGYVILQMNDSAEGMRFNVERPEDFTGHSLSVSDVIALKRQNEVKYYYVDSVGFKELPGFDSGRNPLRSIEDMVEQNDNQLDGVINNVPAETVAEKEAKSSVIEKLKVTAQEKNCSKCHRPND